MAERKRVLIVIDWYLPADKAGGPVRSIAAVVSHLKNEFEFYVFTGDRDLGDATAFNGIAINEWTKAPDGTQTWYARATDLKHALTNAINRINPDIIYINGILSALSRTAIRIAQQKNRHILVAPRGMLGAGALRIKPLRKKIFLTYGRCSGMFEGVVWHASSEQEKAEILGVFPGAVVKVALNLSLPVASQSQRVPKEKNRLHVIFLSRISEKKNLKGALEIIALTDPKNKISLTIYGPIENQSYWQVCSNLISALPEHVAVNYKGALPHQETGIAFSQNDLMLFPTYHENFGHTIIEALQVGTPVLISDQTPWKNLEKYKAGWELPLNNPQAFADVIDRVAMMSNEELMEWKRGAIEFARSYAEDPQQIESNRALFAP